MAGPLDFLSGVLGNSTVKTLFTWQVGAQVVGALMAPFDALAAQEVWKTFPVQVLPPDVLADLVLRGWMSQDDGAAEASKSGIDGSRFQLMIDGTGEPPGPQQLLEAFRRGIIDQARLVKGIKESRVRDEWIDVVEALRYAPPPTGEVLAGWVQNHLTADQANQLLVNAGVDPAEHEWLYETHGRPPGAQELLHLMNRGAVSQADVEQAIRESDIKDKYIPAIIALATYVPPVRTVTALNRSGAITDQRAAELYRENGVRPEDAAAYIAEAHAVKTTGVKNLALGEVGTLYEERAITPEAATKMIEALDYSAADAAFILEVYDLRHWRTWYNAVLSKIRTLFIGRHIDATRAQLDMDAAKVPPDQKAALLALWQVERDANVHLLTPAQILKGNKNGKITDAVAQAKLVAQGYSTEDADFLIAIDGSGDTVTG